MVETIQLKPPAAPGNNAIAVLFDSTKMDGKGTAFSTPLWLRNNDISWFEVSFLSVDQASAAAGLKFYASEDDANWDQIEAGITVGVSVAGVVDTYRRYVGGYRNFKAELTAGATGPTVWRVSIKLTRGDHAKVT